MNPRAQWKLEEKFHLSLFSVGWGGGVVLINLQNWDTVAEGQLLCFPWNGFCLLLSASFQLPPTKLELQMMEGTLERKHLLQAGGRKVLLELPRVLPDGGEELTILHSALITSP